MTPEAITRLFKEAYDLLLDSWSWVQPAPLDPHSLDLPSIGALLGFYHACLGFPVKQTWLDAIKAGNCDTFEGITYSNAAKYCPDADKTIMGHLAQQCQNVRLTKPKQPMPAPLMVLPTPITTPSNQVYVATQPLSKHFTGNTGCFPVRARSGNQYVMIVFHADGNLIPHPTARLQDQERLPSHRHLQRDHDPFGSPRSLR